MAGALEHVKVLDVTVRIGGAHAATLLAEMGADVIKVEPLDGEPWRNYKSVIPHESRVFQYRNRGKRGIAVDLQSAEAAEIRERLIRWADVIITNYPLGVPEQLGIDDQSARAVNPSIICCDMTRLGKQGALAGLPVDDVTVQALSGMQTSNQGIRNGLPQMLAFIPTEMVAALAVAFGISAALVHRERTGEGQSLTTSSLLAALFLQSANMSEIVAMDAEPRGRRLDVLADARARGASLDETFAAIDAANYAQAAKDGDTTRGPSRTDMRPGSTYERSYRVRDGFVAVNASSAKAGFCEALGVRDASLQPGFEAAGTIDAAVALQAACEPIFAAATTAEITARLAEHGVACVPVKFVDEMWDDEHVLANGYITEYDHPKFGRMRGLVPLVQMSATPAEVRRPAPGLGQHTDEVLQMIGLGDDVIADLRRRDVIR